jgi:hypothetical protein
LSFSAACYREVRKGKFAVKAGAHEGGFRKSDRASQLTSIIEQRYAYTAKYACLNSDSLHQSLSQLHEGRSIDELNREIGRLQHRLNVSEDKCRILQDELDAYRSLNVKLQQKLLENELKDTGTKNLGVESSRSQSLLQQAIDYFVPGQDLKERSEHRKDGTGSLKHPSLTYHNRYST